VRGGGGGGGGARGARAPRSCPRIPLFSRQRRRPAAPLLKFNNSRRLRARQGQTGGRSHPALARPRATARPAPAQPRSCTPEPTPYRPCPGDGYTAHGARAGPCAQGGCRGRKRRVGGGAGGAWDPGGGGAAGGSGPAERGGAARRGAARSMGTGAARVGGRPGHMQQSRATGLVGQNKRAPRVRGRGPAAGARRDGRGLFWGCGAQSRGRSAVRGARGAGGEQVTRGRTGGRQAAASARRRRGADQCPCPAPPSSFDAGRCAAMWWWCAGSVRGGSGSSAATAGCSPLPSLASAQSALSK
jgi:hypothetical protein